MKRTLKLTPIALLTLLVPVTNAYAGDIPEAITVTFEVPAELKVTEDIKEISVILYPLGEKPKIVQSEQNETVFAMNEEDRLRVDVKLKYNNNSEKKKHNLTIGLETNESFAKTIPDEVVLANDSTVSFHIKCGKTGISNMLLNFISNKTGYKISRYVPFSLKINPSVSAESRFFTNNWQWIISTIFIPLVLFFYRNYIKKKKLNAVKNKQDIQNNKDS